MAADLFLLDMCQNENVLFLRIYSWEKSSITIGLLQKAEEILDNDALKRDGVTWIRRPTGGRAVLHFEDLTYSCVFSQKIKEMGTTIKETYSKISQCLRTGLSYVGITSEAHDSENEFKELKREIKLPCFLASNRNEIMINGRKLVGSAQRRTTTGVLQHGSIPMSDAYLRLPDYLSISDQQRVVQKKLLEQKTTCISRIDKCITYSVLWKALIDGFRDTLNAEIVDCPWTQEELSCIGSVMTGSEFISDCT